MSVEILGGARVVPVVVLDNADVAVELAECLVDAGMHVIEVTLRTETALESIKKIAKAVPKMVLGVGSLRTPDQIPVVIDAGVQFTVAPGATDALIDAAKASGVPFFPGAATPSEVMHLFEKGIDVQKFFPAEVAGGIPFLKAVGGPIQDVMFMPTGGISAEKAVDYLALKNVACVGGSWITPKKLLDAGDFDAIHALATAAVKL